MPPPPPPTRLPRLPRLPAAANAAVAVGRGCPGDAPLFTRESPAAPTSRRSRSLAATASAAAAPVASPPPPSLPPLPAMDATEERKHTTQVRTLPARKPKFRAARPNDYLYDPTYVVAGQRDFQRCGQKALKEQRELELRPNFRSMFSDHPRYPRLQYTVRCPGFTLAMQGTWEAKRQQALEQSLAQEKAGRGPCTQPCGGAPGGTHVYPTTEGRDVRGVHRHLFFRRPVAPPLAPVMPPARFGAASPASTAASSSAAAASGWPCVQATAVRAACPALVSCEEIPLRGRGPCEPRHKGIQTDFREQETQTIPWQPPHSVHIGQEPEVLTLATLSWGNGLPAGLLEVELIERMRVRRAWERALKVPRTPKERECFERALARLDRDEWMQREREIEAAQCERLRVASKLLEQCRALAKRRCDARLKRAWARGERVRDRKIAAIRKQRERELRKLTESHRGITHRYKRQPVIEEHADVTSQLYGPLARYGLDPRDRHEVIDLPCEPHQRLRGLDLLDEEPLPFEPAFDYNAQSKVTKNYLLCPRQTRWNEQTLEALLSDLRQMREPPRSSSIGLIRRIYKEPTPPSTPTLESVSDHEEKLYQATVFLQKMIKGRAVQCLMFQGLRRCRELIGELKTTHGLSEEATKEARNRGKRVLGIQQEEVLYDMEERRLLGLAMQLQGTTVSMMLDFLNKELVRLQQERLAHAFALLAERSRQNREAGEAGRRQAEERRRREHDEMWRQVLKVHQDAIDTYLEDVILNTMERTADAEARRYVQHMVQQIDKTAEEANEREDAIAQEELVADLLHSFLLPEVEKQLMRERHLSKQKRLLLAAHDQIYERLLRPKERADTTHIPKEPPPLTYFPESKWQEPIPEKASVEARLARIPSDHMCWQGPDSSPGPSETILDEWTEDVEGGSMLDAARMWLDEEGMEEEDMEYSPRFRGEWEGEDGHSSFVTPDYKKYRMELEVEEEEEDIDVEKTLDKMEKMLQKVKRVDPDKVDEEETLAAMKEVMNRSSESSDEASRRSKTSKTSKISVTSKLSTTSSRKIQFGEMAENTEEETEETKRSEEVKKTAEDEEKEIQRKMSEVQEAFSSGDLSEGKGKKGKKGKGKKDDKDKGKDNAT